MLHHKSFTVMWKIGRFLFPILVFSLVLIPSFIIHAAPARQPEAPPNLTATESKLLPRPVTGDAFGRTIAIDGDTAVIAATLDDEWSTDSGAIYIFRYNGTAWVQEMKWVGGEGTANRTEDHDQFGWSVAIDGDTVVVGAPYHPVGDNGVAYTFFRTGSVWTEQTVLLPADPGGGDQFGYSVDVSGDTIIVGAPLNEDIVNTNANVGAAYIFTRSGSSWTQQAKLLAGDAANGDEFGHSVGLEGDTALVGSWRDDDGGTNTGSVYVFTRSGTVWTQQTKFTASDRAAADTFGNALSLDGNTAVIGSVGDDDPNNSGAAYVFQGSGSSWAQQAKLKASDAAGFDQAGSTVSISGDRVVVGAFGDDTAAGANAGSVYVFERSGISWSQVAKITPADAAATDEFGTGAAVSGTTIIAGAPFGDEDNGTDSGAAYVYQGGGASWAEQTKLKGINLQLNDNFGYAVAIDGDTAVVTLPYDDDSYEETGAAFIFERVGGVWQQAAKVRGADTEYQDEFGCAAAIDGNTIAIGARRAQVGNVSGAFSGAVYIFVNSGSGWTQQAKLTPVDAAGGDIFGCALALSGDTLLATSAQDDDFGSSSGSAYIFQRSGTTWSQQAKLLPGDGAAGEQFGYRAALSEDGNTAVIGVPFEDGVAADSGAVYVFQQSSGTWTQQTKLTASDAAGADQFGMGVGITADTIIVGSPRDDDRGSNSGSVYVYQRTGTTWAQTAKLNASDSGNGDQFGYGIAVSGNTFVAGSTSDDDGGTNTGAVYVWQLSQSGWLQQLKVIASDPGANDQFGTIVSLRDDRFAVGVPFKDSVGVNAGAAYVYEFVAADVGVYKSDSPDPVTVGDSLTYIITATNAGPSLATDVVITDTLPGSVTLNSAVSTQGSCTLANPVICTIGNLAVNQVVTVTIGVTPNTAGVIVNTAVIGADQFDYNTPNNTSIESTTVTTLPVHVYAAPDVPTCASFTPCFAGAGSVQTAFNNVANNGLVTILGSNNVNSTLTTGSSGTNNATMDGSGTLLWTGGAGTLFAVGPGTVAVDGVTLQCTGGCGGSIALATNANGALTMENGAIMGFETAVSLSGPAAVVVRGNSISNVTTVFNLSNGSLLAYVNNITNFTLGINQTGGTLNGRHNWWGDAVTAVQVGNTNAFNFRLGADVVSWGEGTLGGAALASGSGTGTPIVVSHGRGEANAPFAKATTADGNSQCSDYYDFFVINGNGSWTVTIPIDNIVACDTTYNTDKLFVFALAGGAPNTACTPDTACWNLLAGVSQSPSGHALQVTLDAATYLQGTPLVAGNDSGEDPTAVSLSTFSVHLNGGIMWGAGTAVFLLLFTWLAYRRRS